MCVCVCVCERERERERQTDRQTIIMSVCVSDGEKGAGGMEVCVCGGGVIYLSLHCHHQNDSCIKVGSDESHFNISSPCRCLLMLGAELCWPSLV